MIFPTLSSIFFPLSPAEFPNSLNRRSRDFEHDRQDPTGRVHGLREPMQVRGLINGFRQRRSLPPLDSKKRRWVLSHLLGQRFSCCIKISFEFFLHPSPLCKNALALEVDCGKVHSWGPTLIYRGSKCSLFSSCCFLVLNFKGIALQYFFLLFLVLYCNGKDMIH